MNQKSVKLIRRMVRTLSNLPSVKYDEIDHDQKSYHFLPDTFVMEPSDEDRGKVEVIRKPTGTTVLLRRPQRVVAEGCQRRVYLDSKKQLRGFSK